MGLFDWLFGNKPRRPLPEKKVQLPPPLVVTPTVKEPLKKGHDTYVKKYLEPIINLQKKWEYHAAFKLCKQGLPYLGPYMQYLKKNRWWSEKENPPLLHFGLEYAAIIGDIGFINSVEEVINNTPELEHKKPLLNEAQQANKLKHIIIDFLKDNPGYPRAKLKTAIEGFDEVLITNTAYNMAKYGIIRQSKLGNKVILHT